MKTGGDLDVVYAGLIDDGDREKIRHRKVGGQAKADRAS